MFSCASLVPECRRADFPHELAFCPLKALARMNSRESSSNEKHLRSLLSTMLALCFGLIRIPCEVGCAPTRPGPELSRISAQQTWLPPSPMAQMLRRGVLDPLSAEDATVPVAWSQASTLVMGTARVPHGYDDQSLAHFPTTQSVLDPITSDGDCR
jgi:hypothetical protein